MATELKYKPLLAEGDYPAECTAVRAISAQEAKFKKAQYQFDFELYEPHVGRTFKMWATVPDSGQLSANSKLGRLYSFLVPEVAGTSGPPAFEDCIGGQCLLRVIQEEVTQPADGVKRKRPQTIVRNTAIDVKPMPPELRRSKIK